MKGVKFEVFTRKKRPTQRYRSLDKREIIIEVVNLNLGYILKSLCSSGVGINGIIIFNALIIVSYAPVAFFFFFFFFFGGGGGG